MVLSGTKRTSSMSSITNANQGGGSKKAGFAHTIGRDSWTSIFMGMGNSAYTGATKKCVGLACVNTYPVSWTVKQSRPTGPVRTGSDYW